MRYLSIALIVAGILIFMYSIIVDMKKRRMGSASASPAAGTEGSKDRQAPPGGRESDTRPGDKAPGGGKRDPIADNNKVRGKNGGQATKSTGKRTTLPGRGNTPPLTLTAILYEDGSRAVDYTSVKGVLDPGLDRYKSIKRIGSGELSVERGGINFSVGRKLYRYDFHRIRDIKTGAKHLALFIHGTDAVKLFIFDHESDGIAAMSSAYRDYARGSEQHV